MSEVGKNNYETIYDEMMSHPALFSHPRPQKIGLVDEKESGILGQVLKHPTILQVTHVCHSSEQVSDPRVKKLTSIEPPTNSFDVIILNTEHLPQSLITYYDSLANEGILLYQSTSPFDMIKLKSQYLELKKIGFYDIQILNFPQPHYPTGWRSALLAIKNSAFKRIREKDIFNRTFRTQYYNFDIHKAAIVLPEFMREELNSKESI